VVLGRNLRHGRGEIDVLVRLGGTVVAVEVKTAKRGDIDPVENFTPDKAQMVRQTAARLRPPAKRIDLITVVVDDDGAALRWLPDVA